MLLLIFKGNAIKKEFYFYPSKLIKSLSWKRD